MPLTVESIFQHVVTTYASETNKTVSMWRAVPDDLVAFKLHEKTNSIRTILVHQLLSERRFFAQFIGTRKRGSMFYCHPAKPGTEAYIDKYLWLARRRLPRFAMGVTGWWLQ